MDNIDKIKTVEELSQQSIDSGILKGSYSDLFNPVYTGVPLSSMANPSRSSIIDRGMKDLVFACIDKRAEALASLDYIVTKPDKKELSKDNFVLNLLSQPNPLFTWYQFIYLFQVYMLSLGEVFIYVVKGKYSSVKEMWILPSQYMNVLYPINSTDINKTLYELDTPLAGIGRPKSMFRYDEIIYVRKPHPKDIYRGRGILQSALLENDINLMSKQYVRNFYQNGAVPGGVLETDKTLDEAQVDRIKHGWNQKQGGVNNAWEISVLFGGLSYKKVSVNPASADFIAQSNWARDDLMALFGVPPVILGYPTTRGAAQEQHSLFYKLAVYPDTVKVSEAINVLLFKRFFKLRTYIFKFTNTMPTDEVTQIDKARVGGTFGAITYNELRNFLGLVDLTDLSQGNTLVEPLNNPSVGSKTKGIIEQIDGGIVKLNSKI